MSKVLVLIDPTIIFPGSQKSRKYRSITLEKFRKLLPQIVIDDDIALQFSHSSSLFGVASELSVLGARVFKFTYHTAVKHLEVGQASTQ